MRVVARWDPRRSLVDIRDLERLVQRVALLLRFTPNSTGKHINTPTSLDTGTGAYRIYNGIGVVIYKGIGVVIVVRISTLLRSCAHLRVVRISALLRGAAAWLTCPDPSGSRS